MSNDPLSQKERSERISRVRNKDTKVELRVRRFVYSLGNRYRLHSSSLPGHPDLVFPGRKKVIFIHGCFWHRHEKCALARLPKSRLDFWVPKLEGNRVRDQANEAKLRALGWDLLVVWECESMNFETLEAKVTAFLGVKQ